MTKQQKELVHILDVLRKDIIDVICGDLYIDKDGIKHKKAAPYSDRVEAARLLIKSFELEQDFCGCASSERKPPIGDYDLRPLDLIAKSDKASM